MTVGSVLETLDAGTRGLLRRYGFDEAQFRAWQARVADGSLSPASNVVRGTVEPPGADEIIPLPGPEDAAFAEAQAAGATALRRSEVAIAVLNGGMATRFGGVVKGLVEAVDGRSFLEWKLLGAARVARAVGGRIPVVVMNSFATEEATRAYLAGLARDGALAGVAEPLLFNQFVSLRMYPDGSLFLDADERASPYATGHGDFAPALRAAGVLDELRGRGVRLLMLANIDNLGARPDPAVIGMHLRGGRPLTMELIAKSGPDVGGAPARVDGRTMVLESFRFPPEFDQDRIGVFSINSFVFDLEALDATYPLTWFYVEKQVEGRPAVQLERLVNELSNFIPTTYLQVPRSGLRGRFFPIKTPADLEASRPALREMLAASVLDED